MHLSLLEHQNHLTYREIAQLSVKAYLQDEPSYVSDARESLVMLESFLLFLGSSKQSKDLFLKKGLGVAEILCSYSKTCFCFVSNF